MENKDVAKNENKDAPFSYLNLQKFKKPTFLFSEKHALLFSVFHAFLFSEKPTMLFSVYSLVRCAHYGLFIFIPLQE